jgi:hypothetical protein
VGTSRSDARRSRRLFPKGELRLTACHDCIDAQKDTRWRTPSAFGTTRTPRTLVGSYPPRCREMSRHKSDQRPPSDYSSGKKGDVLVVEFRVHPGSYGTGTSGRLGSSQADPRGTIWHRLKFPAVLCASALRLRWLMFRVWLAMLQ